MKIYSDTTAADGTRRVSLLGIRVYKKWKAAGAVKRAWFQVLFKSVRRDYVVRYYLLGIRVYRKKDFFNLLKDTNARLNTLRKDTGAKLSAVQKDLAFKVRSIAMDETRNALIVARQHQKVFPRFKNIHHGQSVVIVGSGPTLNRYVPIPGAIHIALNKSILYDKVKFDYLFCVDYRGIKDILEEVLKYDCVKFFGNYIFEAKTLDINVPEYIFEQHDNVFKFYDSGMYSQRCTLNMDISEVPLYDMMTIAHCAMHFALYTHPRKIYIVGVDCGPSSTGQIYFNNMYSEISLNEFKKNRDLIIEGTEKIKCLRERFYPDVEIISVNPVGLKGMFRDVYTDDAGVYVDEKGSRVSIF